MASAMRPAAWSWAILLLALAGCATPAPAPAPARAPTERWIPEVPGFHITVAEAEPGKATVLEIEGWIYGDKADFTLVANKRNESWIHGAKADLAWLAGEKRAPCLTGRFIDREMIEEGIRLAGHHVRIRAHFEDGAITIGDDGSWPTVQNWCMGPIVLHGISVEEIAP